MAKILPSPSVRVGLGGAIGLALWATASAASAAIPAKIETTQSAAITTARGGMIVDTPAGAYPVYEFSAANAVNPEGASLIRAGNHKIPRPAAGKSIELRRAVADADNAVYVWYRQANPHGGYEDRVRKIAADNQLGFDRAILFEDDAGVAPDGAGGAYVASHKSSAENGEFWRMHTNHTTYRLSPTGDVVWQFAEASAPKASGALQTVAAASPQGVFVAYAIEGPGELIQPVLLHRKAASGAIKYRRVGLRAPAAAALVGDSPLYGRPSQVFAASDGTAIATIDGAGAATTIVHLNTAGAQTAAYGCQGYRTRVAAHASGDVLCLTATADGVVAARRFAIRSGKLKSISAWTASKIAGWKFRDFAVTPGGQVFAVGDDDGAPGLALFSSTGELLTKRTIASAGRTIADFQVATGGAWLALVRDDNHKWSTYRGTYSAGATLKKVSTPTARQLGPALAQPIQP